MNMKDFLRRVAPRLAGYRIRRLTGLGPINPITLTFSVTAACQSRCRTCQIGHLWMEDPTRSEKDLTLEEIEKIFKSMKPVYFFNISGGEPFLRKDLPEIVELACKHLKPRIVHTPTNAIMPEKIESETRRIMEIINAYDSTVPFTVKPSIDGVGDRHDDIRGHRGNFEKLKKTIDLLKKVSEDHENFHLELGTVISNFNIDHLDEIAAFVKDAGVESYRNEVAEQRAEFFNKEDPITPDAETYRRLITDFSERIRENIATKRELAHTTEALRLVYYDIASRILAEDRQVIPCYAGISNVHINYDGGVWPCCVLGYDKEIGNLRDVDYDFAKVWHSKKAKEVRGSIRRGECACPLANQAYSNILLHAPSVMKALGYMREFKKGGKK